MGTISVNNQVLKVTVDVKAMGEGEKVAVSTASAGASKKIEEAK